MGISRLRAQKFSNFTEEDISRIIRMGWEDRSSFESIEVQFGLNPNELVLFMRKQLQGQAFRRWRRRVFEQGKLKNENQRGFKITRFKCSRQSVDGITKAWK